MSSIDFPDNVTKFQDKNGLWWHKVNGSWVKQLDYVEEANNDGLEYCRLNSEWSQIAYPIATDVPEATKLYARKEDLWVEMEISAGPAFPGTIDPYDATALYGIRGGVWDIFTAEDFDGDVYSMEDVDLLLAGKAAAVHTHVAADVTDLGTMALVNDTPDGNNGVQYVRQNHIWAPLAVPDVPIRTKAITIIDPIESDDALISFFYEDVEIVEIRAVALGSGTQGTGGKINFNVLIADAANGSATYPTQLFTDNQVSDNVPAGEQYIPNTKIVPAGYWAWVQINSGVGVNTTMFHLTIVYKKAAV